MLTNTQIFNSLARKQQYKFPFIFLGFYLTFLLSTVCLAGKLTLLGNIILPGGIFVFPLTFCICDIVGEVYGYAYPRIFIWIGALAELIFSFIVCLVSHLAAPEYFKYTEAYKIVFDPTIRYVLSSLVGLMVGEFLNIYLLAKSKLALRGKFFMLRSLLSTALGQAALTIIVDVLNYTGKMPHLDLLSMMLSGFLWKIFFALFFIFPSWMVVRYLKKLEGVDHFDKWTDFNPFSLNLENPEDRLKMQTRFN